MSLRAAGRFVPLALIGLAASVLLLWGLDRKYLWQDEANTAVLAVRMLKTGKPLAYDGQNFVGLDHFPMEEREPPDQRTGPGELVVDYYIRQEYLKPDTAWKWHPWGQFVMAAASIRLLGQTTLAARLPFALAGIATVLLLYRLAAVCCASARIGQIAGLLLTLNAYWILHNRQCRYYSLTSLFLVLTLLTYSLWQRGAKRGMAWFVLSAWCWFQVDYGTVWPVLLVLFADAFAAHGRRPARVVAAGALLAASIGPFVWYYELLGRLGVQEGTWTWRFRGNLFNMNEYVIPWLVLAAALALLAVRWKELPPPERRTVAVCCGIMAALALWVPSLTTSSFLRYAIMAAPAACLVAAWFLVRAIPERVWWAAWPAAAVLAITPWAGLPAHFLVPPPPWYTDSPLIRSELSRLGHEVFGNSEDINREVVEFLSRNARPADEILVNYEDMPLMYYLPNPIRGGISAFRVEDDVRTPPRFLVLRPGIPFVYWPAFLREAHRYRWESQRPAIPSATWGNNPDPMSAARSRNQMPVLILRRADP